MLAKDEAGAPGLYREDVRTEGQEVAGEAVLAHRGRHCAFGGPGPRLLPPLQRNALQVRRHVSLLLILPQSLAAIARENQRRGFNVRGRVLADILTSQISGV